MPDKYQNIYIRIFVIVHKMMSLLKDSNCYIIILCFVNLFGGIKASNDTKLVSMMEIQPSPVSENENVETKNNGMVSSLIAMLESL